MRAFTPRPNSDQTIVTPSAFNAPVQRGPIKTFNVGPVTDAVGFAVNGNQMTAFLVTPLFLVGAPFYVAWFVVPVIIDAFKAEIFTWFTTQTLKKLFVRGKQEFNTAFSVSFVGFISRVSTSFLCLTVSAIFRRSLSGNTFAVGAIRIARPLFLQTPARLGSFMLEIGGGTFNNISTDAPAPPITVTGITKDGQTVKPSFHQIVKPLVSWVRNKCNVFVSIMMYSHNNRVEVTNYILPRRGVVA